MGFAVRQLRHDGRLGSRITVTGIGRSPVSCNVFVMELADDILDHAVVARLPCTITAKAMDTTGRRIVEVQCSTETVDYDGDVIMQSALLDSANSFVGTGHLDIDHLSEFGARMGIPDPSSYIVGRPMEVKDAGDGSTFVRGEISRSSDGRFDPVANRYDEFWSSLQRDPPVVWFSSIYGFPTDLDDCRKGQCASGATRYLIKALDWRSLAFTRTPKNLALTSPTRIVSAKSYLTEIAKAYGQQSFAPTAPPTMQGMEGPPIGTVLPNTMADVWSHKSCAGCGVHKAPSLLGYRQHFTKCLGFPAPAADLYAHAVMHKTGMVSNVPALDADFPGPEAMPGT